MASTRTDKFSTGLYAHWLDGEWLKVAYPIAVEGPHSTLAEIAEGGLKLHALFGTRIAISDVQLTDSDVTVRAFANPEFRQFLKVDPHFLTLISSPPKKLADSDFSRAMSGLYRACEQDIWRTSLTGISANVIKRFGAAMFSSADISPARCLKDKRQGPGRIIAEFPEHAELLEGILHGVYFFTKRTGGRIATQQNTKRSYIEWLQGVLNTPGLLPSDYGAFEEIWSSIKAWVPDESQRYARSSLNTALESKQPDRTKWPPEWHRLWQTVVHAWNSNVCDNLGMERSSILPLPSAVLGLGGPITDAAGPFRASGNLVRNRFEAGLFTFDPTRLNWSTVGDVVKRTRQERRRLQTAISGGDVSEYKVAKSSLIERLNAELAPRARHVVPGWVWSSAALVSIKVPILHPVVVGLETLDKGAAWLRTRRRRAAVFSTLRQFAGDSEARVVHVLNPNKQGG